MYTYILIPGRSHSFTTFQSHYLQDMLANGKVTDAEGNTLEVGTSATIVWAITSGNHANTRRNPIPGPRRLAMCELVSAHNHLPAQTYLIPNMEPKPDFAHYVVEEIRIQSKGSCDMTPQNTIVVCSTLEVIAQYQALGYAVALAERKSLTSDMFIAPRPWDLIEEIINKGDKWRNSEFITEHMDKTCIEYFERYNLAQHINAIFNDPLTSTDGDITVTRDYESYRAAFEDNAFRKVEVFAPFVQPGRIVDVGCATGQTIKLLSEKPELFESDFYGIEAARPLYDICEQRRNNGAFGSANVFFYQRNIMHSEIFPSNTVNTIITMALTHEIESYMGRDSLLEFLKRMYDMLAPGGVYINYDVVGPTNKDMPVWVQLTDTDGDNPNVLYAENPAEDITFFKTLSSKARFKRFAQDFRKQEGDTITVTYEHIDEVEYAVLRYADFCDFLAKKDYVNSWFSEMHERFCFWNYQDWARELTAVGFQLHEASAPIQNPWLIENRFAPAAKIFTKDSNGTLLPVDAPDTNIILIAKKPL